MFYGTFLFFSFSVCQGLPCLRVSRRVCLHEPGTFLAGDFCTHILHVLYSALIHCSHLVIIIKNRTFFLTTPLNISCPCLQGRFFWLNLLTENLAVVHSTFTFAAYHGGRWIGLYGPRIHCRAFVAKCAAFGRAVTSSHSLFVAAPSPWRGHFFCQY